MPGRVDAHTGGQTRPPIVHEDVVPAIGVARDQIGGLAEEGHVPPVRGDLVAVRVVVSLVPRRIHAHSSGQPRPPVAHEGVHDAVGVARHQVGGHALERHVAAVPGDRGAVGAVVRLAAARIDAHARGPARVAIVHEDVLSSVGVSRHQVRRAAGEQHAATVAGDLQEVALVVPLPSPRVDAHPGGPTGPPVVNEGVVESVRVARHQVGGPAAEGHEAAVRRDRGIVGVRVRLLPCGVQAHPRGLARQAVVHEAVDVSVGVARHQVVGPALEGHVATVRGDRGPAAVAVALAPRGVDAHAGGLARVAVVHVDVELRVGVPRHELAGGAEGHVATVRGERVEHGRAVALLARRAHVDPRGGTALGRGRRTVQQGQGGEGQQTRAEARRPAIRGLRGGDRADHVLPPGNG